MLNSSDITGTESSRARIVYAVLMSVCVLWLAVIVAPPILVARGHGDAAMAIYHGLSGVCHQMPSRSFHLHGFPFAVCSRCTGIYVGFTVGGLLYPFARGLRDGAKRVTPWVAMAVLPMLIDFSAGYLGVFENTFLSRTATGALAGAAAAFYLLPDVMTIASPAIRQSSFKEQSWL